MSDSSTRFVLVPLQVDAFLINDSAYVNLLEIGSGFIPPDSQSNASIPAPFNPPNHRGLSTSSNLIQPDVFKETKVRPTDLNFFYAPPRVFSSYGLRSDLPLSTRTGVCLHWSLPKMYRTAIMATDSAGSSHEDRKLQQGFPPSSEGSSSSPNIPTFRPVPDRWIIIRHIDGGGPNRYTRMSPLQNGGWTFDYVGGNEKYKIFVIESNIVRSLDQIPPMDDLLARTSPYIDPTMPLDQQGDMFLGRASSLHDWEGDQKIDPLGEDRISLTVMTTGNPFFADYQQHNSSVFSFYDDLVVTAGDVDYEENTIKQIYQGTLSYTILGYHSVESRDPLVIAPNTPNPVPSHDDRLTTCFLELEDDTTGLTDADRTWLASSLTPQMRTLCHGYMMSLSLENLNLAYPGWEAQTAIRNSHPIAVGTNDIDALLGWMRANIGSESLAQSGEVVAFAAEDISVIEQQLLKIQTLIQSVSDDVDSQLEAADLIATNNFVRRAGGTIWQLKKDSDLTPTAATDRMSAATLTSDVETLRSMNQLQELVNAYNRESTQLKLNLFEEWWRYVADRDRGSDQEKTRRRQDATSNVAKLVQRIEELGGVGQTGSLIDNQTQEITKLKGSVLCESGVKAPFHSQKDPTLLFAGVGSGRDYNLVGKNLPIRVSGQEAVGLDPSKIPTQSAWLAELDSVRADLQGKLPPEVDVPMSSIITESPYVAGQSLGSVPPYGFLNRGIWGGIQAWYPLFFEWTVEYYHVPIEYWDFTPQGPEVKLQYGIKDGVDLSTLPGVQADFRILSGRSPVLPQVASSLQTTLKQLFAKMNPDELDGILPKDQRDDLVDSVKNLQYFSCSMDGFTDQLLTRARGLHLQPNIVQADGTTTPLPEALQVASEIGLDSSSMQLMDYGCPYTPFASLVDIPADPATISPFKPCTHGQFRFTKLQVVDKFGQVVTPVDVMNQSEPTPIFPSLGQTYCLDSLKDGTSNCVLHRSDQMCQFVQLPPSINQLARVNADYVTYGQQGWRPTDEWENPVSGWIVINFPDFSMQVFDQDGHFIREFQVMGSTASHPFKPVDLGPDADPLLSSLMKQFQDTDYLSGIFTTISAAVDSVKHPPTAYAESILSILGKPLAVVKMGFSLELANNPLVNQSTLAPDTGISSASVTDYTFPMKIGDMDNVFDGLVGYFDLVPPTGSSPSSTFDLGSFFSYYASSSTPSTTKDPSQPIAGPFQVTPYYIPPGNDPAAYAAAHNSKRHVVAAFIDPFVPVHAYTQLLPLKTVSLPPWVINSGISRVSAFFRIGPLLIPGDVPGFSSKLAVDHNYTLDEKHPPATTGKIVVPTFTMADWVWLQPFFQDGTMDTEYNFVDLDSLPQVPAFEAMPYTSVEGYLQMKKPFTSEKDDVPVTDS